MSLARTIKGGSPLTIPSKPNEPAPSAKPKTDNCSGLYSFFDLHRNGGMFFTSTDFLMRINDSVSRCESKNPSRSATPGLTLSSDDDC